MNEELTPGIIIKQSNFGEGHRMVWIFTEKYGIIKAAVHGAGKTKSKSSASSQFLTYCNFSFYNSGEIWNINNATSIDNFWGVQEDIKKLALCTYFSELIYCSLDLHNPDSNILRLFLNMLYACSYKNISLESIKLAFEIKLLYYSGLLPRPDSCTSCGCADELCFFNTKTGSVLCRECAKGDEAKLSENAYKVLYFFSLCDMKKLFSYMLPEDGIKQLSSIIESYTISNFEQTKKSLEYYKLF